MKPKKILFVCKHNRFRSKIAEAYFNKIKMNKKIQVKSAGLVTGKKVAPSVVKEIKSFNGKVDRTSRNLTEDLVRWSDITVIVANNVPKYFFKNYGSKVIVWKIPDTTQGNVKEIKRISNRIIKKVDKFNKGLKRGR